ncbi:hypothetical protein, partial [Pseudomonas sp. EMN2]|uniref:hypothetical protein n=1 Tax=Pseudomonas sp. EMN2 TaxID=2615212 RepID=UPI001C49A75F
MAKSISETITLLEAAMYVLPEGSGMWALNGRYRPEADAGKRDPLARRALCGSGFIGTPNRREAGAAVDGTGCAG